MTSSSALGTPPCTGMSPIAVRIVTVASSPSLMPSSTRSRSASSATNAGRGGAASRVLRRASKGSVMIASFSFQVDAAVRRPRSNQQRLGGVGGAPEQIRHLGGGPPAFEIAHGGEERLGGEVLGGGGVAAPMEEVPEHLGHRLLVEGEERGAVGLAGAGPLTHRRFGPFAHDPIIAPSRRSPTG